MKRRECGSSKAKYAACLLGWMLLSCGSTSEDKEAPNRCPASGDPTCNVANELANCPYRIDWAHQGGLAAFTGGFEYMDPRSWPDRPSAVSPISVDIWFQRGDTKEDLLREVFTKKDASLLPQATLTLSGLSLFGPSGEALRVTTQTPIELNSMGPVQLATCSLGAPRGDSSTELFTVDCARDTTLVVMDFNATRFRGRIEGQGCCAGGGGNSTEVGIIASFDAALGWAPGITNTVVPGSLPLRLLVTQCR